MNNIYSHQKILHHPNIIHQIKDGRQPYPIQIHFMPENRCNHGCIGCAYRIKSGKNTQLFDKVSYMPKDTMLKLIDSFLDMGGKAIELTGGGEPLLYKYKKEMFSKIISSGIDYALVTNGTLLTESLAKQIAPTMTWYRVSIDSGTPKTYSRYRQVSTKEFYKAIKSIGNMRKYAKNPQFKLGVGFVVNNLNYKEILDACILYREEGADNVRISALFTPQGLEYFDKGVIEKARELAQEATLLNKSYFTVYNLLDERIDNLKERKQPYKFCPTKELLCVVGGDSNVYLCCSLAFNKLGLIGSIKDQTLKELWDSREKHEFFSNFDASKTCPECLYEERNIFMNTLLFESPLHVNFI